MAIQKTELYSSLWASCDELRGGMDASQYKAELIPPALIAERFFSSQLQHIEQLQANLDSASQELESFVEENSGDKGLLSDALNDKVKVTAASVKARLKLATDAEERKVLQQCSKLMETESHAKKALKTVQDELDLAIFKHYSSLDEEDIKELEERYSEPLPAITQSVDHLSDKVAGHIKAMGLEWSL